MKIPNSLPWLRSDFVAEDYFGTSEIDYAVLACNNFSKAIELLKDAHSTLKIEGYGCRGIEEFLNSLENESNL